MSNTRGNKTPQRTDMWAHGRCGNSCLTVGLPKPSSKTQKRTDKRAYGRRGNYYLMVGLPMSSFLTRQRADPQRRTHGRRGNVNLTVARTSAAAKARSHLSRLLPPRRLFRFSPQPSHGACNSCCVDGTHDHCNRDHVHCRGLP